MKTTQPPPPPPPKRLKPPNRTVSLFSCAFFRHCTDTPLSPTPPSSSPPDRPPPPLLPPPSNHRTIVHSTTKPSDSESSSSSTSQSFTQWRFPPTFHHPHSDSFPSTTPQPPPPPPPNQPLIPQPLPPLPVADLREIFHIAELNFTSGSDSDRLSALHMMEHSLVPNPPSDAVSGGGDDAVVVPTIVMSGVIDCMKDKALAKTATKILLALCLAEGNRKVAVECQAGARVVDVLPDLEGTAAERALAALDLMCTVPEGAAEVRAHALAVPMLVAVMARMEGRGREYTISVLSAVYGGSSGEDRLAPPEEVARAVVLAMQQGDCSARAIRKGAQLLKTLEDNGRLDLTQDP